jgi:hypothetical protein
VLLASLVDEGLPLFWLLAVVIAGVITVVSCSTVGRRDAGLRTIAVAALAAVGTNPAIVSLTNTSESTTFQVAALVFVGLVALGVTIRPEGSALRLTVAGYVTLLSATDDPDLAVSWFAPVTTAVLAGAIAGTARSLTGARAHVAAGVATVAGALTLVAAGVDAGTSAVAASLVGVGLTGLATLDPRLIVGRTAGVVASVLGVAASTGASPIFTSIALVVLGVQISTAGLLSARGWLVAAGATVTTGAIVSLWWTTGTNQWVIDAIAPYSANGSDVAIAAASLVLLVGGWLLRRTTSASSWLAYSPGLGMAGTWLVATQLEPGADWATFGALIVGVVALAIGGVRRLGAPLVLGTLLVITTIVLSAGARLAAAPTWLWIAVGGIGLLVIAALVERSERPLLPVGRRSEQQQSLLEQFCDEFR